MSHFDQDDRYFADYFVKYGVIPTDDELPYEASEDSAMGEYVHPMDDMEIFNKKQIGKNMKIDESKLKAIIAESVANILSEMNQDLEPLNRMSRAYHPNPDGQTNVLDKTFNHGNGSIPFVEIIPDEKVLLVNKSFANRRDMERIQQAFPEYSVEEVSLGYPDWYIHRNLRSVRGK